MKGDGTKERLRNECEIFREPSCDEALFVSSLAPRAPALAGRPVEKEEVEDTERGKRKENPGKRKINEGGGTNALGPEERR
ncbi:hypothetical protein EYF80_004355 [Liparis tanakae]|uniref:Uncharacterized protein n=1 Tax=Liparis tanakae TaxID=230148 RepID=A0A4Z2J6Z5_9TELE|nr:hypothetical protein EYF80_004355 [Liparis tanakae]